MALWFLNINPCRNQCRRNHRSQTSNTTHREPCHRRSKSLCIGLLILYFLGQTMVAPPLGYALHQSKAWSHFQCLSPTRKNQQALSEFPDTVGLVQSGATMGSGVIVSQNGIMLTAAHLLKPGHPITVYLSNREAMKGEVLRLYPQADIAVIQLPLHHYPCLPLAKALPNPNDSIVVLGFQPVQAIRGFIHPGRIDGLVWFPNSVLFLRLSLNLTSGHSGGPILNNQGEVIGIVSAQINPPHFFTNPAKRKPANPYILAASTGFLME